MVYLKGAKLKLSIVDRNILNKLVLYDNNEELLDPCGSDELEDILLCTASLIFCNFSYGNCYKKFLILNSLFSPLCSIESKCTPIVLCIHFGEPPTFCWYMHHVQGCNSKYNFLKMIRLKSIITTTTVPWAFSHQNQASYWVRFHERFDKIFMTSYWLDAKPLWNSETMDKRTFHNPKRAVSILRIIRLCWKGLEEDRWNICYRGTKFNSLARIKLRAKHKVKSQTYVPISIFLLNSNITFYHVLGGFLSIFKPASLRNSQQDFFVRGLVSRISFHIYIACIYIMCEYWLQCII